MDAENIGRERKRRVDFRRASGRRRWPRLGHARAARGRARGADGGGATTAHANGDMDARGGRRPACPCCAPAQVFSSCFRARARFELQALGAAFSAALAERQKQQLRGSRRREIRQLVPFGACRRIERAGIGGGGGGGRNLSLLLSRRDGSIVSDSGCRSTIWCAILALEGPVVPEAACGTGSAVLGSRRRGSGMLTLAKRASTRARPTTRARRGVRRRRRRGADAAIRNFSSARKRRSFNACVHNHRVATTRARAIFLSVFTGKEGARSSARIALPRQCGRRGRPSFLGSVRRLTEKAGD